MPVTTERPATRDRVLAFRLDGHNLVRRRPSDALLDVAATCGIRNTPPGSAVLAVHARVAGLPADALECALDDRTLVEVLSVRISPLIVPARDAAVFTVGTLPDGEESIRSALGSVAPALREAGVSASEALRQATDAAHAELGGQSTTRAALSAGMTERVPEALVVWCRACNARHVSESLFRLAGVSGAYVIARTGKDTAYVSSDRWLGAVPQLDRDRARAELLRRYLRCFGPSTAEDFATWAGIGAADARRSWDGLGDRLVAVETNGRPAWLHADDLARFDNPPTPSGVRLLPPYDAYLDQRDRTTLMPDKALHRRVWKAIGNPGVVLADGEVIGLWRPKKAGKRLQLTVEALASVSRRVRTAIEAEAALLAPRRGCTAAEIAFAD